MYVLVEFEEAEGGGVAIIDKRWLTPRKKEVFWPPVKEQKQFDKILKCKEYANMETWKIYKILRCFYETGMSKS